jgi:hypothetical protein
MCKLFRFRSAQVHATHIFVQVIHFFLMTLFLFFSNLHDHEIPLLIDFFCESPQTLTRR